MASYQSLLDKISALQKKASSLRDNEKRRVIAEMRKLIELYDMQPAELFSNARPSAAGKSSVAGKSSAVGKPVVADKPTRGKRAKRVLFPKYRDPATGKTWNGHGKRPFWLVGDRDAYLIDKQADAGDLAAKPKRQTRAKTGSAAGRKSSVDKVIADVKRGRKGAKSPKRQTSVKADAPPPETDDSFASDTPPTN
ncbi:MAG: H-NS histone family protein [Azoarcus sp.]|jgi:DNA-binding protein H-NS|nr:H-NS histone family protein [Azoarcus sp.]